MKLVYPESQVVTNLDGAAILRRIEEAGRTCYKSEAKMTDDSARAFVRLALERGHHSIIEHENITVRLICDRGVTHELVRHRLAAYSQESTRYCNYGGGVTYVIPPWVSVAPGVYEENRNIGSFLQAGDWAWFHSMFEAEVSYLRLLRCGWTAQQARSVLPNSLKTEIVMTANVREWRHVLKLRTSQAAHPQMRELMLPLLLKFRQSIPVLFDDLGEPVDAVVTVNGPVGV